MDNNEEEKPADMNTVAQQERALHKQRPQQMIPVKSLLGKVSALTLQ